MVLLGRLFFIQVIDRDYEAAAEKNIIQCIEEIPYRGEIYDRHGKVLVYNEPSYDLMVIPQDLKNFNFAAFSYIFQIPPRELQDRIRAAKRYAMSRPSVLIKDISHLEFARFQEELDEFPGLFVQVRPVRKYSFQVLANTLGYMGEVGPDQLARDKDDHYRPGDLIGVSGLEKQYEATLRGKRGAQYKIMNAKRMVKGNFKGGELDSVAVPGKHLTTTIDIELQLYAEKLMKGKVGSIVAIEPATGEILALVSSPSYDPNLLVGRKASKAFSQLARDSSYPLFHRPVMAVYPPGSVFKSIQALIALQEGVLHPGMVFPCNKILKCHHHPPGLRLHGAIKHSCNPYFYHVFRRIMNQRISKNKFEDARLGLEKWHAYTQKFGLGSPLGIDIPNEKGGLMPDVSFYNKLYGAGRWKTSTIRSLDIGQGEMQCTPLQMANLAVILGNRGFYYTPHLVKKINEEPVQLEEDKKKIPIDPNHFRLVVNAMQDTSKGGTAWRAHIKDIPMCGKTGTIERSKGKIDHAAFVAFAPTQKPKIALSVYVEEAGWGARSATAIGGLLVEKYIKGEVQRKAMEAYVLRGEFLD